MLPELNVKRIKQEAWHKQIEERIFHSKRPIDKMSISEINHMYEQKTFICDDCGKQLDKSDIPLEDHISHLINPFVLWSCENCVIKCMKENRMLGATEEPVLEDWKLDNR